MSTKELSAPADDYAYWLNALQGNFGPVHDSDPQAGFYRKRVSRGGAFVPVAIWRQDEDRFVALIDSKEANPYDQWTFVCKYPVTEEAYHIRMETGRWPDEDPTIAETLTPPSPGHNNPPQDDAEILKGQIDAAATGVDDYAEIADDETAAKAQSLRSRLLELSREADKKREAEKKPHLEAGKATDAKWQPLVKLAKGSADAIAKALGAHETRKARIAAELQRKADEERRKAEEVARAAEEAGKPAPPPPPAPEPEPAPVAATPIRGAYGRAASVKVVKVAKVEDYDEATTYFRNDPEYRAVIDKLAQRAVTAGHEVPGVTVTEERKVS